MRKVRRWLKRWWWTFVLGAATIAGFMIWLLLPKPKRDSSDGPPPKTFKEKAQEQVERVRLEGEVEKARVAAKAESQNEQLDQIEEVGKDDPAEARRRLATWMAANF
jgi:hypothetical protein